MKEYRETTNMATTNARQKFRMELDEMLRLYENNELAKELFEKVKEDFTKYLNYYSI